MSQSQPEGPVSFSNDPRLCAILDAMVGPILAKRDHDIRNLLYPITGFAQVLRDGLVGPVSEQQKEFLGHIFDCAAKAQALLASPPDVA